MRICQGPSESLRHHIFRPSLGQPRSASSDRDRRHRSIHGTVHGSVQQEGIRRHSRLVAAAGHGTGFGGRASDGACRDRSLCHCDTLLLLLPVLLLLPLMLLPLMLLPLMLLPLLLLSAMIIIVRHRRSSSSSTTTTINDTAAASTAASAFRLVGTSQMLAAGVSCRLRHLTLHVLASARLVLELLTYHGWIERPLCIAGDVADVARHDAHDQLGRSGQTAGQRVGWLALDARRICSCCARLLGRSPCRARWRAAVARAAALRLEGLKIAAVAAAAGARAMKEDLVALVAARGKALLAEHACVVSLASPAHPGDIAVLEDVAARRGTVSGCHGGSFPKESNRVGVNCDRPRRHE